MPGLKNMAAEGVARVASILNLEPPINIPDLAEELEIEHMIRPLEQGLRGIWFHTSMDDSAHIVISAYLNAEMAQFTGGHEIMHELIARKTHFQYDYCCDSSETRLTPLERACNHGAALLLMPARKIEEWWNDLRSNPECRISILASRCQVTRTAMHIRLTELGLI